jgi:hypothetical protein
MVSYGGHNRPSKRLKRSIVFHCWTAAAAKKLVAPWLELVSSVTFTCVEVACEESLEAAFLYWSRTISNVLAVCLVVGWLTGFLGRD